MFDLAVKRCIRLPQYALLLLLPLSCAQPVPDAFPLTAAAVSDHQQPLSGVELKVNGKAVGMTDNTGRLRLKLSGSEGDRVALSARCPDGYRDLNDTRQVTLRRFNQLDTGQAAAGPELVWQCLPAQRLAALVVRSDAQPGTPINSLPIIAYGKEVGRTGPKGTGHVLLRMPPGSSLSVLLDTTDRPDLRPRNPRRTFQLDDRDTIFVFDQRFEQKRRSRPRRRKKPQPETHIPYRIQ